MQVSWYRKMWAASIETRHSDQNKKSLGNIFYELLPDFLKFLFGKLSIIYLCTNYIQIREFISSCLILEHLT